MQNSDFDVLKKIIEDKGDLALDIRVEPYFLKITVSRGDEELRNFIATENFSFALSNALAFVKNPEGWGRQTG